MEEFRAHAVGLSEKCLNLEKTIFTLDNFTCNEDIAFYSGFPTYNVFMVTHILKSRRKWGEHPLLEFCQQ